MFLSCDVVALLFVVFLSLSTPFHSFLSFAYKYQCRAIHRFIFHRSRCFVRFRTFYRFLFTEHSNFQFTFVLFSPFFFAFTFFRSVIDVVLMHFFYSCNREPRILRSVSLSVCVPLVACGISTEFTNTDCNSKKKRAKKKFSSTRLFLCCCCCWHRVIAFGWVDIAWWVRGNADASKIFTSRRQNTVKIIWIFYLYSSCAWKS